jgi:hypothetical protein
MHWVADGIPELMEAPAPKKTSSGWSFNIPIERTIASTDSVWVNFSSTRIVHLNGRQPFPAGLHKVTRRRLSNLAEHLRAWRR